MENRSVPAVGLANTTRFAWKEKEVEKFGRETFGRTILIGLLKLGVKDVLCLQENPLEGAYDVTFYTEKQHEETMRKVKDLEKERPMSHYAVTSLARTNFRVVTVTMYNPHVKEEEVRTFLGRYMDSISSGRLLKDSLGFWTGRRCFQALLREDPKGLDGFLHPPAMFSLGADRGTLNYARQPPFCRRCMAYGHTLASCGARRCRFCGSEEHEAGDCVEPKKCHGCGSVAHLWRDCPARRRSYSSAAGGGARAEDGGRGREEPKESGGRAEQKEKESEGGGGKEEERAGTEKEDGTEGEVVGTEEEVAGMEGEGVGKEVGKEVEGEKEKKKKKKKTATRMEERVRVESPEKTTGEREETEEVVEMEPEGEAAGREEGKEVTGEKKKKMVMGEGMVSVKRAELEELKGIMKALVERKKEEDMAKERESTRFYEGEAGPSPPSKRTKKVGRRRGEKKGAERGDGEVAGPSWAPSPSSFKPLAELDLPGMARSWMMEGEADFLFLEATSPVRSPEEEGVMDLSGGQVPGGVAVFRGGGTVGKGGDVGDSRVEVRSQLVGTEKKSTG
uniref:CCHC-type domain-containing protein n=1 Tax=Oncorhynchus mykiss TaxID=8022 RepID=A0A8K9UK27_ONCMY